MIHSNPFAVNVPGALEALTVGDQSYKTGCDFMQQRQQHCSVKISRAAEK